jgi:hypothetical protein
MCSLYAQLKFQEILQELIIIIRGMKCIPFLIGNVAYPIHTNLQKNWKIVILRVDKITYDSNMNSRKVIIENAFGSLKNRWKILKHFNSKVNKTSPIIVVVYFIIIMKCGVYRNLNWQMQE